MTFNWADFYTQVSSGVFLLVMTGLVGVLWRLSGFLKDLPRFIDKLDEHEKRHEVNDDLWSAHIGTLIKTDAIANDRSAFPFKKWKASKDTEE